MTIEIISDVAFNDPDNLIPYLEKDESIVRGVTKGMLDFSHPDCYAGSGAISAGATFNSLTVDAGVATANTGFSAIVNGMLPLGVSVPKVTLPNTFKLNSTAKKFLAILWVKLPSSGWQTGSASISQALLGHMSNTSTLAQWGIYLRTVQATGVADSLRFVYPTNASIATELGLTNADTLALCDGNLHQVGVLFDGTPGATRTASIWVDMLKKQEAILAWDNSALFSGAADTTLGVHTAFQGSYPGNAVKLGRPSLWDLTGSTLTTAAVLQLDWDAAQGYLS